MKVVSPFLCLTVLLSLHNSHSFVPPRRHTTTTTKLSTELYQTLYDILGATPTDTRDEIKQKFKKLAKQSHPDAVRDQPTNIDFKEVAAAWRVLGDPDERMKYNVKMGIRTVPQSYYDYQNNMDHADYYQSTVHEPTTTTTSTTSTSTNTYYDPQYAQQPYDIPKPPPPPQNVRRAQGKEAYEAEPYQEIYDPRTSGDVSTPFEHPKKPKTKQFNDMPKWMKTQKTTATKANNPTGPSWARTSTRTTATTTPTAPRDTTNPSPFPKKQPNWNAGPKWKRERVQPQYSTLEQEELYQQQQPSKDKGPPEFHPEKYVSSGPEPSWKFTKQEPSWKHFDSEPTYQDPSLQSQYRRSASSQGAPSFHTERYAPDGHAPSYEAYESREPGWKKNQRSASNTFTRGFEPTPHTEYTQDYSYRQEYFDYEKGQVSSPGVRGGGVPSFEPHRYAPPGHSPLQN